MIVLLLFFRLEKANVYHLQAKKVKHQADAMVSTIDILTTSLATVYHIYLNIHTSGFPQALEIMENLENH